MFNIYKQKQITVINFKNRNPYFVVMITTIIITRILLFLLWESAVMKPQIDDSWHHIYTGILLILATIPFSTRFAHIIRAIGFGFFTDESIHIYHLLFTVETISYWSWESWLALLLGTIFVGRYYYKIGIMTR